MKLISLLTLALVFFSIVACGQSSKNNNAEYTRVKTYQIEKDTEFNALIMKELIDPKSGQVTMYMPLPADWQITSNGIEGPDGTILQEFPGGSFNGQQRQISSVDQIIREDIAQRIQRNNAQFLGTIDLPEIERRDQLLASQYWEAMPNQRIYQTKGVEVRHADGRLVLLVVHFTQTRTQYGIAHNGYYLHVLTSNEERYEKDKEIMRFALANRQSNPKAVVAFNEKLQRDYIQRQRLFDERMRQARATFNAWNKSHVETWNSINESSMASWRAQGEMRDAGHARTVDGILERERIVDPNSGRQLDVDAGYKYYYTNGQGDWLGTNSEFFNPAQDPNLNHQEWQRTPIQGND